MAPMCDPKLFELPMQVGVENVLLVLRKSGGQVS